MLEWLKKYKNKIFAGVAVIGVLAAAFWYGGSSPDSHGWTVPESSSADVSSCSSQTVGESVSQTESSLQTAPQTTSSAAVTTALQISLPQAEETVAKKFGLLNTEKSETAATVSTGTKTTSVKTTSQTSAKPTETTTVTSTSKRSENYCSFSISCKTILDNMDSLDAGKESLVPDDGVIFSAAEVEFSEGETVFDLLQRVCRKEKIHLESSWTPIYNSAYVEGIANLYEFDCGSMSGWVYKVNGETSNVSCSEYKLKKGDVVEFAYTCDLGEDVK